MRQLRIALDIDDTLSNFSEEYAIFCNDPTLKNITKNVYYLRNHKDFWENLKVIHYPDFVPHVYCTRRINSKRFTKNWLLKNNLPDRPVYQIYSQTKNKADVLRGRCDLLIDDDFNNVLQCINSNFPALLIHSQRNKDICTPYKIYELKYKEIEKKYDELFRNHFR